jgi:hypothetical protein
MKEQVWKFRRIPIFDDVINNKQHHRTFKVLKNELSLIQEIEEEDTKQ